MAAAQERNGFWIGFDIGAGLLGTSASGTVGSVFSNDRGWTGGSGLGLGWTVNPHLLAGIELRSMGWNWWPAGMEGELIASNLSGILTYYPRATSGFYIKGGLVRSPVKRTTDGWTPG